MSEELLMEYERLTGNQPPYYMWFMPLDELFELSEQ